LSFHQSEIILSLQAHFASILNQLFAWAEGLFHFETDLLPPADKITVRMNLENLRRGLECDRQ
jgi:hypothetical protein